MLKSIEDLKLRKDLSNSSSVIDSFGRQKLIIEDSELTQSQL